MLYFNDLTTQLYLGDARGELYSILHESIDCVVTSPPYWQLRAYEGVEPQWFGRYMECTHDFGVVTTKGKTDNADQWKQGSNKGSRFTGTASSLCKTCGGWLGDYGQEPTPQMYIEHSMEYLDSIWRVLKDTGTVFWNIGDSYIGSGGNHKAHHKNDSGFQGKSGDLRGGSGAKVSTGRKAKDLALIPFRFAIAAQERGWYVRSTIIWQKSNPMPEPVKDRPSTSHEYIFLLTKADNYYWNQDAIREPHTRDWSHSGGSFAHPVAQNEHGITGYAHSGKYPIPNPSGHNSRSVWTFATQGYSGKHFATFPEELPRKCISAGCPADGVVLDLFAGAATTLLVAKKMGRKSIGVELSPEYCALAVDRIKQHSLF